MTIRRRMIPFALVGVLALLTLGLAVVAVHNSPSQAQISLQIAAEQTAQAASFSYTEYSQSEPSKFGPSFGLGRTYGVWRAPDRWQVRSDHGGASTLATVAGGILRVSSGHGLSLKFRVPLLSAEEPLTDPNGPVLSLPPLGLLSTATNISRNGDAYSFEIPRLEIGVGWVAYAPLSHATAALPLAVALNTPARVVIKDGYVVSLYFPHGIQLLHRGGLRIVTDWNISQIGTATLKGVASAR